MRPWFRHWTALLQYPLGYFIWLSQRASTTWPACRDMQLLYLKKKKERYYFYRHFPISCSQRVINWLGPIPWTIDVFCRIRAAELPVVTGDVLYNRRQAKQTWVSCLIVTLPIWFILNKLALSNLLSERNQLAPRSKKLLLSLKWNLKSFARIEPDSFGFNQLTPDSEAIISETLSNI